MPSGCQPHYFALFQIFLQCFQRWLAQHAESFLAAFAAHLEEAAEQVQVFKVQCGGLADAQAGAVNHFKQGAVPGHHEVAGLDTLCGGIFAQSLTMICRWSFQQCPHLFDTEYHGQATRRLQPRQQLKRVARYQFLAQQKTEKRAQTGELSVHGVAFQPRGGEAHGEVAGMALLTERPGQGAAGRLEHGRIEAGKVSQVQKVVFTGMLAAIALLAQILQEFLSRQLIGE